jgi:C-terminal processing protease CtpA/Prc
MSAFPNTAARKTLFSRQFQPVATLVFGVLQVKNVTLMKIHSGFPRAAIVLLVFLSYLPIGPGQQIAGESTRIDRLVAVAKLWAAVKYFHPYLAYRDSLDWDGALVRAIPKVDAARDGAEYSAAVGSMLNELGDPATHVLNSLPPAQANSSSLADRQPTFRRNADGVLVVAMTNYSDFQDFVGATQKLEALKKELPTARAVVFDLRPDAAPSDSDQGFASYAISQSGLAGALTSVPLEMPGERRRMHIGYVPEDGATSGDYSSGFYVQGRQPIKPGSGAKDIPVIFLIGPHADLPEMALAFQASGRGAIVSEGSFNEEAAVSTQTVELPDGVRAQIRLGELVYADGTNGFEPNLTLPASGTKGGQNPALKAAIQLAGTGKFSPPTRARLAGWAAPLPDKPYADMQFPAAEYRVLAAFRVWAVINYFFPYRELMGEDWNEILRRFIPRMEGAKDALDYNLAVAEMVTHIHDSHGSVTSPVLRQYFGDASAPVRVRMIEGLPVITAFTNAAAAKAAGLEIGDVILKVDGEDASHRIAERLKYTAHSTPQAGLYIAGERSLVRGTRDSTATLTVRDVHDRVREVKVVRKVEYMPATQGDRTGEVFRVLPGNIGYADLDRLSVPQVDEMFEKFKDCPAIIFDDRGYPNGTAWQIAPRLTDKADVTAAMFKRRDPMSPDFPNGELLGSQEVTTFLQSLPRTAKWRYHGRTVMLIDERTISQAEHTGLFLEAANGTKFIGSPTQGANGDVTNLSVPGGIYVRFTGQAVMHADGRQLQRVGLQPNVEVRPTVAGIRAGKDEVLERAIEYLENSLR